jgi:hypothetical protein
MSDLRNACVLVAALVLTLGVAPVATAVPYTFTKIDVPFAETSATQLFGINANGQIVGSYRDANFSLHRFLRERAHLSPALPAPHLGNRAASTARCVRELDQLSRSFDRWH